MGLCACTYCVVCVIAHAKGGGYAPGLRIIYSSASLNNKSSFSLWIVYTLL